MKLSYFYLQAKNITLAILKLCKNFNHKDKDYLKIFQWHHYIQESSVPPGVNIWLYIIVV